MLEELKGNQKMDTTMAFKWDSSKKQELIDFCVEHKLSTGKVMRTGVEKILAELKEEVTVDKKYLKKEYKARLYILTRLLSGEIVTEYRNSHLVYVFSYLVANPSYATGIVLEEFDREGIIDYSKQALYSTKLHDSLHSVRAFCKECSPMEDGINAIMSKEYKDEVLKGK